MHSLFLEHQIDTFHMNQIPVEIAHMYASEKLCPVSGSLEHLRQKGFFRALCRLLHSKISMLDPHIHMELLISTTYRLSFSCSRIICMTVPNRSLNVGTIYCIFFPCLWVNYYLKTELHQLETNKQTKNHQNLLTNSEINMLLCSIHN